MHWFVSGIYRQKYSAPCLKQGNPLQFLIAKIYWSRYMSVVDICCTQSDCNIFKAFVTLLEWKKSAEIVLIRKMIRNWSVISSLHSTLKKCVSPVREIAIVSTSVREISMSKVCVGKLLGSCLSWFLLQNFCCIQIIVNPTVLETDMVPLPQPYVWWCSFKGNKIKIKRNSGTEASKLVKLVSQQLFQWPLIWIYTGLHQ